MKKFKLENYKKPIRLLLIFNCLLVIAICLYYFIKPLDIIQGRTIIKIGILLFLTTILLILDKKLNPEEKPPKTNFLFFKKLIKKVQK